MCGGLIEIHTDPKNSEYVVAKGARKRDYGPEDSGESLLGTVVSAEEKDRRAADPFASLEGRVDEGIKVKDENWWVDKLKEDRDRDWDDVWSANRRLRKTFRDERKVLQAKERNREELSDRLGLSIEVLDEVKEDGQRAALINFGESEETANQKVVTAVARPLFDDQTTSEIPSTSKEKKMKVQMKSEKSKTKLQHSLRSSTRAVVDPFLSNGSGSSKSISSLISGIKRKRSPGVGTESSEKSTGNIEKGAKGGRELKIPEARTAILVDYNSDDSEVHD
jgi:coiled-coil domain-containing protein 130